MGRSEKAKVSQPAPTLKTSRHEALQLSVLPLKTFAPRYLWFRGSTYKNGRGESVWKKHVCFVFLTQQIKLNNKHDLSYIMVISRSNSELYFFLGCSVLNHMLFIELRRFTDMIYSSILGLLGVEMLVTLRISSFLGGGPASSRLRVLCHQPTIGSPYHKP